MTFKGPFQPKLFYDYFSVCQKMTQSLASRASGKYKLDIKTDFMDVSVGH